jgi:hypothetical protein
MDALVGSSGGRVGRHPSGRERWMVNLWVTPEERERLEALLKEQGLKLAPELLRLLRERLGVAAPEGEE